MKKPSPKRNEPGNRDGGVVRALSDWFERSARELPWRTKPRDGYRSLVSELMLQQTQVSRVLERFEPFLDRFPTVQSLAGAPESDVMAAWAGLGYYRRARLLLACAKAIVEQHGGVVPRNVEQLLELPGIGRYTAGAIASIVFGERAPIVDGNVCRVLQRLDAVEGHAAEKRVTGWAWKRAEKLVALTSRGKQVANFNEGLMELGATVCTPDNPKCGVCPLSGWCRAFQRRLTGSIPSPKPRARVQRVYHDVVVVQRRETSGRMLILLEQRPATGLWAGLWQPPGREGTEEAADVAELLSHLRLTGAKLLDPEPRRSVFATTHREVHFRTWKAVQRTKDAGSDRRWIGADELHSVGISNAHRKLLK